jgi:hypothetical protein
VSILPARPAPVKSDADAATAVMKGLASPRPSLSWPYFVEGLTRAETTRVHNAYHAAKRPAYKCGSDYRYHIRPFEIARATFKAVLAARPRPFAEPDPVDAALASVRPRVDGFGEYPIGLSDLERSEVLKAGSNAMRRAGYTQRGERASVEAARYRLKVLLASRPRPEPAPSLDVPVTVPPLLRRCARRDPRPPRSAAARRQGMDRLRPVRGPRLRLKQPETSS